MCLLRNYELILTGNFYIICPVLENVVIVLAPFQGSGHLRPQSRMTHHGHLHLKFISQKVLKCRENFRVFSACRWYVCGRRLAHGQRLWEIVLTCITEVMTGTIETRCDGKNITSHIAVCFKLSHCTALLLHKLLASPVLLQIISARWNVCKLVSLQKGLLGELY